MNKIFPSLIIALNLGAAVMYALNLDGPWNWRMVVYWTSAAALNFVVTW